MAFDVVPPADVLARTAEALSRNGFEAVVASDGADAKQRALALVPADAEVMVMTSVTLDTLGISRALEGHPGSARRKLAGGSLSPRDKKTIGCVPGVVLGSVHAVTQDGHVLIASASGSQLPAHVYGAGKVIWVAGGQKVVADTQEGIRRVYEHCLPLEDARARKVYGVGSAVNNLLIMNAHSPQGRITLILVPEKLGF
ncbi:MAG TPA: LUD domain-containing protein [Candidatus Polarisedimenticolia bacterium]|nr:LUD domain-containing protein [Candidatus Polarisedimenticolia bacterium]